MGQIRNFDYRFEGVGHPVGLLVWPFRARLSPAQYFVQQLIEDVDEFYEDAQ